MTQQKKTVEMGDEVKDLITGFTGIVTSISTYLHGMNQVGVQPPIDKEGKVPDCINFDIVSLKILCKTRVQPSKEVMNIAVSLGDRAKDPITGLAGTVISSTLFLNGCTRMGLCPALDKDGKPQDTFYFAADRLVLVKPAKAPASERKTGGPMSKAPPRF